MNTNIKIAELRAISKTQAKKEIITYLDAHDQAYPSEIGDALGIDYDLVWTILKELKKAGEVQSA